VGRREGLRARRQGGEVAELLTQKNAMLEDIPWIEGNLPTGHRITQRVGLPTVYFRLMNQGVPKSKSLRAQVDEQAAMIEARSEVDIKLAELNGDSTRSASPRRSRSSKR
jgi:hypothetical protein